MISHWISDGTYGPGMAAREWRTFDFAEPEFENHCYLRVVGYLERWKDRTYIQIKQIHKVEDPHEPVQHFFRCMTESLMIERGPPPSKFYLDIPTNINSHAVPAEPSFAVSPPSSPSKPRGRGWRSADGDISMLDAADGEAGPSLRHKLAAAGPSNASKGKDRMAIDIVDVDEIPIEIIDLCADDSESSDLEWDTPPDSASFHDKGKAKAGQPTFGSSQKPSNNRYSGTAPSSSSKATQSGGPQIPATASKKKGTSLVNTKPSGQSTSSNRRQDPYSHLQNLHRNIILVLLRYASERSATLYPNLNGEDSEDDDVGMHIDDIILKVIAKHKDLGEDEFIDAFLSLQKDGYIYETVDELHFKVTPCG
ncbi:hypothetical protein HGRIS_012796 [Hohenbuehelia grisea]